MNELFEKLIKVGNRIPVEFNQKWYLVWDSNKGVTQRGSNWNFTVTTLWLIEFETFNDASEFKGFYKGYDRLTKAIKKINENTTGKFQSPRSAGYKALRTVCENYKFNKPVNEREPDLATQYELAMPCYSPNM